MGTVSEAQFDGLFNVHLKGPFFLTQTLLPLLGDGASIVNLTSATTRVATAGVGWDVVPRDSLAVHVAKRVEQPFALSIALQVPGSMSRGSALSTSEIIGAGVLARVDGELVATPDATPRYFDFGEGPVLCMPLSFGDLVTGWHSTGIRNIAMFVHISGEAFPEGDLSLLPDGPTHAQREY